MSSGHQPLEGGCHCGAVRYRVSQPTTGSMICHCHTCRKTSGAPVVAWISVPREGLSFLQGRPGRYTSSEGVERGFCGKCGTHLTYATEDEPDSIDLTTASLDDPERAPPTHHSWLSDNIDWVTFGDGLPQFRRSRSDG